MASKVQIALFAGLLFYIVANPVTYQLVDALFRPLGIRVAHHGKPTGTGLILHALVYTGITYALMFL